jgi:hypothetical protein
MVLVGQDPQIQGDGPVLIRGLACSGLANALLNSL